MKNLGRYDRPLMLVGLFWAFCVTVSRAFRWPNDWAEAQWLVTYQFGFVKRGLLGTLISPFADPGGSGEQTEMLILVLSLIFFLLFSMLLLWACFRVVEKSGYNISSVALAFVFVTSPYVVMSAHLNGYFDNIVVSIAIIACLLVMRGKVWLSSILLTIGMLVHETTFLVGYPSVIVIALVLYAREATESSYAKMVGGFLSRYRLLFILPTLTILCVVINQMVFVDPPLLRSQLTGHLSNYDFIGLDRHAIVPFTFTISYFEYLAKESPMFFQRITDPVYLIHTGFPLLVLLAYAWYTLGNIAFGKLIFFALALCALLPLTLHVIAWDTSRIWLYPLVVVMLALWGLAETYSERGAGDNGSNYFFVLGVLVVIFQIFISTPLMDEEVDRYTGLTRMLYYSPSLVIFAIFSLKWYRMTKEYAVDSGT